MKFRPLLLALAAAAQCAHAAPPDTQAVEFFNPALQHYFITADANEALGIDSGAAGSGWVRTGRSFGAWKNPASAPAGATAVCRFYSTGANSHFFTASASECASLKALEATQRQQASQAGVVFTGWAFEGIAFTATAPAGANGTQKASVSCPAGTEDIFRAYNNGFANGLGANHRFVNDATLRDLMVDRGWTSEGVAFCAPVQDSGTSAPAVPTSGSYPELVASWSGPSNWEAKTLPGGASTETRATLAVAIVDDGTLTGTGNGCTLAGALTKVDGFRVFYTGNVTVAACADTRFNGAFPLKIERLGSGALQLHFGLESSTAEVEVESLLTTATTPPPVPPPATGPVTWVGTVAWIATQSGSGPDTVLAAVNQPLSLTLDGTALTGTGFGCTFAGTLTAGNEGKLSGPVSASGCQQAAFNGAYTQVSLQRESGVALEVELDKSTSSGQTTTKARIRGVLSGQDGTGNPPPPPPPPTPPETPPATTGSWSGDALFLAVQRQNGNSTTLKSAHETLTLVLDKGALSGTGLGCTFAGTLQVAGSGLTGTATATGCSDANFNGAYSSVALKNEDNGAIEVEFEKEASAAQGSIRVTIAGTLPAGTGTVTPPPPPPPPVPPAPGFVLAGTWGASDVEWTVVTRQSNNQQQTVTGEHALSLTISSGNTITGSGFGCGFTGSVTQPVASVQVFVATLLAAGCTNPAFNGSYSQAGLHASDEGALELEIEREVSAGGGAKTTVRIEGRLTK